MPYLIFYGDILVNKQDHGCTNDMKIKIKSFRDRQKICFVQWHSLLQRYKHIIGSIDAIDFQNMSRFED